jgi:hypothetical protein
LGDRLSEQTPNPTMIVPLDIDEDGKLDVVV